MAIRYLAFVFSLALGLVSIAAPRETSSDQRCQDWFDHSKIKPGTQSCEQECSLQDADIRTFDCNVKCPLFCKVSSKKVCSLTAYWTNALNAKASPFSTSTEEQRTLVEKALSRMPKDFQPKALRAIAVSKSKDPFTFNNPASSTEDLLVLFPPAFASKEILPRILFHEIVHFLVKNELKNDFDEFREFSGWKKNPELRPGGFVEKDGQFSPEEDFANDIEYFVFDPIKLKSVSPEISAWIDKKVGLKVKLQKGCHE